MCTVQCTFYRMYILLGVGRDPGLVSVPAGILLFCRDPGPGRNSIFSRDWNIMKRMKFGRKRTKIIHLKVWKNHKTLEELYYRYWEQHPTATRTLLTDQKSTNQAFAMAWHGMAKSVWQGGMAWLCLWSGMAWCRAGRWHDIAGFLTGSGKSTFCTMCIVNGVTFLFRKALMTYGKFHSQWLDSIW